MRRRLPIEDVADAVCADVRAGRNVVVWAPPGTGKTTALPPRLHRAAGGGVLVVEPRRIAARLAARFVAARLGVPLGEAVGYRVRFDHRAGPDTRITYVTDGMLAHLLRERPDLAGTRAVVFDEFHERRLAGDVGLARVLHLQRTTRPDLRVAVLSATLDAPKVAAYLGGTVHATKTPGFPVEVRHAPPRRGADPIDAAAAAVLDLFDERPDRAVLVFLPGAAEIRRVQRRLAGWARARGIDLRPLHGRLDLSAQAAAVARQDGPRVVLATNVAESAVTVEGVGAVVDTGLARTARFDPALGATVVQLGKIAKASCLQRTGRAGREGPGVCVRCYTKADFDRRPDFETPSILRADLARAILDLACAGAPPLDALPLFDAPPPEACARAREHLRRIGAFDGDDHPTAAGRAMATLPLDLPLARLVVAGRAEGIPRLAARAAAALTLSGGRADPKRRGRGRSGVDVLDDLTDLDEAPDGAALRRRIDRVARQLCPRGARDRAPDPDDALVRALVTAMPERVGALRPDGTVVLASGASARLAPDSAAAGAPFVVAVAAEHRRSAGRTHVLVTSAAATCAETVVDVLGPLCEERRTVELDPASGRARAVVETRLGAVLLDRREGPATEAERRCALSAHLSRVPLADLPWSSTLAGLRARARAAGLDGDLSDEAIRTALARADYAGRLHDPTLAGAQTLAAVLLGPEKAAALDRLAPRALRLPNGVWVRVHYDHDGAPRIEAPIQWFFGVTALPRVGPRPVTVHLLAPNRRAVQVTGDLAGFWRVHYPAIARTLRRRYPRHPFPDDPGEAAPPPRAPRRPPRP